jgi:AcrR family transcriptional regulator
MSLGFLLAESDPPSKREIMRCALSLFVRDGLSGASIRAIARAGGYTNPALYKFFPTKDALALHLFERCYAHLLARIEASQAAAAPFRARLEALVRAYAALLEESLEAVLYVDETLRTLWPRLPAAARKRSLLGLLRGLVDAGRREGAVAAGTDAELAVALLVGTMAQVARMAYFDELPRRLGVRTGRLLRLFEDALAGGFRGR